MWKIEAVFLLGSGIVFYFLCVPLVSIPGDEYRKGLNPSCHKRCKGHKSLTEVCSLQSLQFKGGILNWGT